MHSRHGLAGALGLLLALAFAAPASGAVTADVNSGNLNVRMSAAGDVGHVVRDGSNLKVIGVATITGGPATVTNVDGIIFHDNSGSGGTTAVVDHSGGRFEPGATNETGASDELEFAFDMGDGDDLVRVILLPTGQEVAIGNTGINFNPLEPNPKDDDVDNDMTSVESVEVQGGAGDDTVTGSSTLAGAGVDPATMPLKITGGGGDDDLTGGNGNDQINSHDGDNNDVISCRGGTSDSATADFLDAVGTDCESITRPSQTTTPPPASGDATTQAGLPSGRVRVRRGRALVRIRCVTSQSGTCRGRIVLRRRLGGRVRRLGSAPYSVARGQAKTVRVRLSRAALRAIRRRGRLRVTLIVTVDGGQTRRRSVLLRR